MNTSVLCKLAFVAGGVLAAAAMPALAATDDATLAKHKQAAVELIKSLETGDTGPIAVINPGRYIQHDLDAADGLAGFANLVKQLPPGQTRADSIRAFAEGDYVFVHTDYDFFGPKIGFDIYRFQNDKIIEHWDNLQLTAGPNPSGHTMVDGPAVAAEHDKTEANKTVVAGFVHQVLAERRIDRIATYVDDKTYIQHDPSMADGISGLKNTLVAPVKAGQATIYTKTHKILGEGNFVLAVSEGISAGKPVAFYDLFRVEHAKIVEHWDVIQVIPPPSQWKNTNGKFGFPGEARFPW
jgi:predicted SnoaL-like aldol condensation-catalyzing enzyme